jgi:hypothetical protein
MVYCSGSIYFDDRRPRSLTPINPLQSVQRGFTKRAAFEGRIPTLDEDLLYL